MFNGIVESIGIVQAIHMQADCMHIVIMPQQRFSDLNIGDSIAVNGVCLTLTHISNENFSVTAVPETLRVTNLKHLTSGNKVNLERSLLANGRLGGHFVQGHVDQTGKILDLQTNGDALLVKISVSPTLSKYIVNKGYIALDGMSITVIEASSTWFTVTFIPHTQQVTVVHQYQIGSEINIEVDSLGKYIEKLIGAYSHAIPH
ncbi:MAG: riboflavin synthase [Gammaproteobacteria bacterium]